MIYVVPLVEVAQEISLEKAAPSFVLLWGRPVGSSLEKQAAQNSNLEGARLGVIIRHSIPRSRLSTQTLTQLGMECQKCVKGRNHRNLRVEGNSVNHLVFFFVVFFFSTPQLPSLVCRQPFAMGISRESVKA